MIPLIDAAIGFIAIMVTLSLLVKSLTSLIKNYVDYYTENLRTEVDSFLKGMVGEGLKALEQTPKGQWLRSVNWKVIGEEYLTTGKMQLLLERIGEGAGTNIDLQKLTERLELHVANLRYAFGQRMKNLALASGLGLCLLLDVNALTIWKTLYTDQQIRSTFASEYSARALALANELAKSGANVTPRNPTVTKDQVGAQSKAQLEAQSKALRGSIDTFMADVSFGVGRIWRESGGTLGVGGVCYEFLGALLTGLLVSIGAPYWHDLLRALTSIRRRKEAEA